MTRQQFDTPVTVALYDEPERISSIADAADFLRRFPVARRGPVYWTTLNVFVAVKAAQATIEDGRRAFLGFARHARIVDFECGSADTRFPLPEDKAA